MPVVAGHFVYSKLIGPTHYWFLPRIGCHSLLFDLNFISVARFSSQDFGSFVDNTVGVGKILISNLCCKIFMMPNLTTIVEKTNRGCNRKRLFFCRKDTRQQLLWFQIVNSRSHSDFLDSSA